MSIRSIYLSYERLNELLNSLDKLEFDLLYISLKQYLDCNNSDGEYLCNIFNEFELRDLERIDEDYNLFNDVDTIFKAM